MTLDELDDDEQLVVMVASLLGFDFTEAMLRGAAVAVSKSLKRRVTGIWRDLRSQSWAYKNELTEQGFPAAVAAALTHPQRQALFAAAEKAIRSRSAKSEQGIWKRARGLAWLGVLQRDELAIEEAAQSYEAQSDSRHIADPIQLAWECAGGEAWMPEPRILRLRHLISKLLSGNAGTQRSPESVQVANELNTDLDLPIVFMDAVADFSLLRGDRNMLQELEARHDGAKSPARAFLAFLDCRYGDAVRALDEAEALRDAVSWTVVAATVRVLTSIACGDLAGARKTASNTHRGNAQTTAILRRLAQRWEAKSRIDRYSFSANTLLNGVLLPVVHSWQHSDIGQWEMNQLASMPPRCAKLGWHWLAAEAARAYQVLCDEHSYDASDMKPYEWPTLPLGDLKQVDDWRVQLRSITRIVQRLAEPDETEAALNQKRLAWVITRYDDDWELLPYEQKMGKRGWTKGRSRYFSDLVQNHEDLDYLDDLDHQICKCVQRNRRYGYYYSEIDWAAALPLLAEHPRLFRDNTSNALSIRPVEAELHVVEDGDTVKLLTTPYCTDPGAVLFDDEYDSMAYAIISNEFAEIARVVGAEGLVVPAAESAQVAEICEKMGHVATVHSDLEPVAGVVVEGDPRAHMLLAPLDEGLQMQLRVRPVTDFTMQMPGRGARQLSRRTLDGLETISRDHHSELRNAQVVLDGCPLLEQNPRWVWKLPEPQDALETLLELQDLGDSVVLEWPNSEPLLIKRAEMGNVAVSIGDSNDWFTLDGELRLDADTVFTMREVVHSMRNSQDGYLRMGNGQIIALADELRKPLDSAAAFSHEKGGDLRLHPLAGLALREFAESAAESTLCPRWKDLCDRVDEVTNPRLPPTLRAELRDYQRIGYDWLHRLGQAGFGACLADDMGLGKTVQALGLLLARGSQGPALVIAPTSVCANWANEAARFAPTLTPVLLRDYSDRAAKIAKLGKRDLLICSYGLLPFELDALSSRRWATLILDEAQAIKNPKAKRTAAAGQLEANMRIAATGTPIENRLNELWSIFNFLNPGLLGTRADFDKRWGVPIQEGDSKLRNQLRKLLSPFILRRRKEDVLSELPPKTEIVLEVELSDKDLAFYEVMRREAEGDLSAESGHLEVLAHLTRLRRTCCSPHLVNKRMPAVAAKLKPFAEIIDELRANGHRALVFSQFVGHLALLRSYLDNADVPYQYLDGSTPAQKRDQRVAAFQDGEGDLFLISLKAGGTGLNLTGADYVIHMDPWWNPAAEDQASDRAHRMGQTRPVTVYRLVARGTIEEKIVKLHTHKRSLADGLLSGNETATPLTLDDLTELLRETN
jgi:superfamily II DNA or RNA helicase